jgi:drug/metabolite transporter (DMT)-like permease
MLGPDRNLTSGLVFALAALVGAAAGSTLIAPMLFICFEGDRPTVIPTYELGVALGIIIGTLTWQWSLYVWNHTDPPTKHA